LTELKTLDNIFFMKRGAEHERASGNGQTYCRARHDKTQGLVPVTLASNGDGKKICKTACMNGKLQPHDLPTGSHLVPAEICNLGLRGSCKRGFRDKIPSGLKV
jgi:hypothetical protein